MNLVELACGGRAEALTALESRGRSGGVSSASQSCSIAARAVALRLARFGTAAWLYDLIAAPP
jgi:hypothetical protein